MEFVEPIRDIEKIRVMKHFLIKRSKRDFLLFMLGINTGLRISQLLSLLYEDVMNEGSPREFLEMKTKTQTEYIYLNRNVRKAIINYVNQAHINENDFLFAASNKKQAITRQQAYRIINQAAIEAGISDKIGTHTLRKTFGYHGYKKGIALSLLQRRFNHETRKATLRYIGIADENQVPKLDVNL
ncbi:tyrosine-type recombinase/integrase [Halalkalibacter krulwichiae]|uniref:Site-specific tyrosine recombinase XerC n=1 Tax=Halalkalibacter krulwichiae TaxID=199441 RepID=A0A1X9MFF7_9BACI|nr:tyrosine-type recombinase/integrase [Halalkalibacter krulwichiae]ARK31260.1 site-specific tyrosine recombinase XerC [Halalkalibacter krulwichiae]